MPPWCSGGRDILAHLSISVETRRVFHFRTGQHPTDSVAHDLLLAHLVLFSLHFDAFVFYSLFTFSTCFFFIPMSGRCIPPLQFSSLFVSKANSGFLLCFPFSLSHVPLLN